MTRGKATTNGQGQGITNAGFLAITASPTVTVGTYAYGIEASYEDEGANGMGSGQVITVTVKE